MLRIHAGRCWPLGISVDSIVKAVCSASFLFDRILPTLRQHKMLINSLVDDELSSFRTPLRPRPVLGPTCRSRATTPGWPDENGAHMLIRSTDYAK